MNEVFISYSRGDSQFVDRLIRDLEQKGVSAWLDREDIEAGDSWRGQITEGIKNCKAFIIVLSPNSVGSKNVSRELSLAESNDRMIIPIVYQACNIPSGMEYQLAELQWINLTAMTYEEGLHRLVRVLDRPAAEDKPSEKRRSDTARLRQALESSTAPSPAAPEGLDALPLGAAKPGWFPKSKLALAALAVAVLAGIGIYSLSGNSSSDSSAEPSPVATEQPAPMPAVESPRAILGNSQTHFYFWPDCPGYDRVPENLRVEFAGEKDATDAGYTEAENCPVPIYGDSNTLLYHRNECPGHDSVPEQRIVEFRNETEAEKAGYKRAADCP